VIETIHSFTFLLQLVTQCIINTLSFIDTRKKNLWNHTSLTFYSSQYLKTRNTAWIPQHKYLQPLAFGLLNTDHTSSGHPMTICDCPVIWDITFVEKNYLYTHSVTEKDFNSCKERNSL